MSKPHPEPPQKSEPAPEAPPLPAGIRRHLGQNLRSYYAETLAEPVSQRLEALLAQIAKAKR